MYFVVFKFLLYFKIHENYLNNNNNGVLTADNVIDVDVGLSLSILLILQNTLFSSLMNESSTTTTKTT